MTLTLPPATGPTFTWPEFPEPRRRDGLRCCRWRRPKQHGPHLPLGTDVMIAQAYLARVRELLPDNIPATFLPLQPVGISTNISIIPAR